MGIEVRVDIGNEIGRLATPDVWVAMLLHQCQERRLVEVDQPIQFIFHELVVWPVVLEHVIGQDGIDYVDDGPVDDVDAGIMDRNTMF